MSSAAMRSRVRAWVTERRRLLAAEDGFVIVIAMLLIVIGLGAGAAALSETISNRGLSTRNERSARALQAANAGIQTELYRANQLNLSSLKLSSGLSLSAILSQLATCPVPQINASGVVTGLQFAAIASVGSACPTNSTSGITTPGPNEEPVGNHGYYQTSFVPGPVSIGDFIQLNPKIVASGVDDNGTNQVSRRVEAILAPVAPFRTLEAVHNLTFDVPPALNALGVKVAGTTTFNGTAAAGNNLTLVGTSLINNFNAANISLSGGLTEPSALDYCNNYVHTSLTLNLTLGSITQPSSGCSGLVNRSAIQLSPSKADCAPNTGAVACTTLFPSTVYPSTAVDEIYNTNSATTISFQPGDYVFCDFQTNGPVSLNPSSTQAVRIFIDSPTSSRCSGDPAHSATGQPTGFKTNIGNFIATQGVGWNALTGTLSTTHPSQAQVYVSGNGTNNGTTVTSTGTGLLSGQSMFLYAPTSNVTVTAGQTCVTVLVTTCVSAGTLAGAFIGYDLAVSGTVVTQDLGLLNYPLSTTLGPFYIKQYIECAPQYPLPTPDPTSGC